MVTVTRIDITNEVSAEVLAAAVDALRRDQVIVLPTDTLYALAADTFSAIAVENIYAMKQRRVEQALPLMAASLQQVQQFARLDPVAHKLALRFWPGPLTLVLPARSSLPVHARAADGTVAVRVPAHNFCRDVAAALRRPLTATSTNISGSPPAARVEEIAATIRDAVALIFDEGESRGSQPSTIVRATQHGLVLIREGQITREALIAEIGERSIE